MISLLGSLLGFGTSILPRAIEIFQDGKDKKHELDMMKMQAELQARSDSFRMDAAYIDAQIRDAESTRKHDGVMMRRASQWVVNLCASVRPTVTYLYFTEFMFLSIAMYFGWVSIEQYSTIWSPATEGLFATIISFWFGSRAFGKRST